MTPTVIRLIAFESSRHTAGNGLKLILARAVATMHGLEIRFKEVDTGCSIGLSKPRQPV